jgi:hypothetical protein
MCDEEMRRNLLEKVGIRAEIFWVWGKDLLGIWQENCIIGCIIGCIIDISYISSATNPS